MTSEKLDINAAASLSFKKAFFSIDVNANAQYSSANNDTASFESSRTTVRQFFMGTRPTTSDANWVDWAKSSAASPFPITYELLPITDLISSYHFPELDDTKLLITKTRLANFIDNWCGSVPDCSPAGTAFKLF